MSRDYCYIDKYLNDLADDIYLQPADPPHEGHNRFAEDFINLLTYDYLTVLDIGCGSGFCEPLFRARDKCWTGVTLGDDYKICKNAGLNVFRQDFNFLKFADNSFDLLFCRHTLEHSPMPLLTLMEWRRVSKQFLALVVPSPKWYKNWGLNHYAVMPNSQVLWLAARAGWKAILKDYSERSELRYVFQKAEPQKLLPFETEPQLMEEYGEM